MVKVNLHLAFAFVFLISGAALAQDPCRSCVLRANGCYECLVTPGAGGMGGCNIVNNECWEDPPSCNPPAGCLLGESTIATPYGEVLVVDINIGDPVLSIGSDGETLVSRVVDKQAYEAVEYYRINDLINVTESHPFMSSGDWVNAGDLSIGDLIVTIDGIDLKINSLERIQKGVRVYSISVGETETYFASGFYVHNKPPVPGT